MKNNKKFKNSYKLHNVDTYRLVIFKLFIVYKAFAKKSIFFLENLMFPSFL